MNIENTEKLNLLLEIIQHKPATRIAHISNGSHTLSKAIVNMCEEMDYEYQLYTTKDVYFDKSKTKYKDNNKINVTNLNLKRPSYQIQGRDYEYLFVTTEIEGETLDNFFNRCYKIIKHAGNIIIFIPKKNYAIRDKYISTLEEQNFVSTSLIDDICDNYDVIVSRRMHGWGNK
jgi:hypothetical protein